MINFIPIFPLEIVVYPGEHLNLHIFEPRYKQLINDCHQTNKPFDYSNVADLVVQDIMTPYFSYIGYLCSVSEGIAYDLIKGAYYLKPSKNNKLIELVEGRCSKHSASMVNEYICNTDDDFLLAESFSDQKAKYALYEYDVLECSPLSLPCDFQGFMSYHPPYIFNFTRESLRISDKEVDSYLSSILEKNEQDSTFLNRSEEKIEEKYLKYIGAMLHTITDKNTQRPHKINQAWIAQTIEDLTKGASAGMSKSTLEKVFRDANTAFEPYKPKSKT